MCWFASISSQFDSYHIIIGGFFSPQAATGWQWYLGRIIARNLIHVDCWHQPKFHNLWSWEREDTWGCNMAIATRTYFALVFSNNFNDKPQTCVTNLSNLKTLLPQRCRLSHHFLWRLLHLSPPPFAARCIVCNGPKTRMQNEHRTLQETSLETSDMEN